MTVASRNNERLTLDEVQSISFAPARLGRRGYDEEKVRAFRDHVSRELVTLLNERTSLRAEVDRLRAHMRGDTEEDGFSGYRPEDGHVQAVRILSSAQQTADRYVADAQEYSRALAEDARRHRDKVLSEAKLQAQRLLDEAHSQASQAAEIALAGAESLSVGERHELQAQLAYLRTFSDVYRTHLRAYLAALVQNVDEWERAEKSSIAAARADLRIP